MFPCLPAADLSADVTEALLKAMAMGGVTADNDNIPAGYTYLGQFVDHDITFDPTSKLQGDNDPSALVDFRTPRFDLDSLYGSGPRDQPFLYDWSPPSPGVKLLVGCSVGDGSATLDLPRNQQGRALIGDARNDENLIISQLHLLFIRFHNRVVDYLVEHRPRLKDAPLFEEAQQIVRWHYQWIVTHDFLERIVGVEMARCVLRPGVGDAGPTVERRYYRWEGEPFIPVEFSGAAYRFGHSMVRDDYRPNPRMDPGVPILAMDDDTGELEHLGGFRRLPVPLTIDWGCFFQLPHGPAPQMSRLIDTKISIRLRNLPPDVSAEDESLPRLNLSRGHALKLPAASDIACAMEMPRLTAEQLLVRKVRTREARAVLRQAPPLWYYVLCEAQSELGDKGRRLGPIGGRIVAEVLVGLLEGDPSSYLHAQTPWTPTLPRAACGDFTMPDLVRFALGQPPPHALPPGR